LEKAKSITTTTSSENGSFLFERLNAGRYTILDIQHRLQAERVSCQSHLCKTQI
jgi:hypothetical protein